MEDEDYERALKQSIEVLEREIKNLSQDPQILSKTLLQTISTEVNNKILFKSSSNSTTYTIPLSLEDLRALVNLRKCKLFKLKSELESITSIRKRA